MPGSVLPPLSGYPWWTAALAIGTGAAISPLCEQVGLWGYWRGARTEVFRACGDRRHRDRIRAPAAPARSAPLWPKWLFFF
jgi:hypothetical protein